MIRNNPISMSKTSNSNPLNFIVIGAVAAVTLVGAAIMYTHNAYFPRSFRPVGEDFNGDGVNDAIAIIEHDYKIPFYGFKTNNGIL